MKRRNTECTFLFSLPGYPEARGSDGRSFIISCFFLLISIILYDIANFLARSKASSKSSLGVIPCSGSRRPNTDEDLRALTAEGGNNR